VYNNRNTTVAGNFVNDAGVATNLTHQGPLHDPTAILYVRTSDLDATGKLLPTAPVEPVVIRAAAGDCINVTLRNKLPALVPDLATFSTLQGSSITVDDWAFFYRCYCQTYREHHSTPYLTRDFFARMSTTMPDNWLLFIASHGGNRIAASLICIDPYNCVAFGRYWGAIEHVPCLHFEACYYQPLAWCIEHEYIRFEGGAQGEHKMARGLLPVQTWSAHWLAHPQFAQAVADFLEREGAGVANYIDDLNERRPFKANALPPLDAA